MGRNAGRQTVKHTHHHTHITHTHTSHTHITHTLTHTHTSHTQPHTHTATHTHTHTHTHAHTHTHTHKTTPQRSLKPCPGKRHTKAPPPSSHPLNGYFCIFKHFAHTIATHNQCQHNKNTHTHTHIPTALHITVAQAASTENSECWGCGIAHLCLRRCVPGFWAATGIGCAAATAPTSPENRPPCDKVKSSNLENFPYFIR